MAANDFILKAIMASYWELFGSAFLQWGASLVAQMVKNLPTVWEIQIRSLGEEDPLDKGMATHSSILAWSIPWTEEPGRLQSMGLQRVGHDWAANISLSSWAGLACVFSLRLFSPLLRLIPRRQPSSPVLTYTLTARTRWCCQSR